MAEGEKGNRVVAKFPRVYRYLLLPVDVRAVFWCAMVLMAGTPTPNHCSN
jgi:hypothetical protein